MPIRLVDHSGMPTITNGGGMRISSAATAPGQNAGECGNTDKNKGQTRLIGTKHAVMRCPDGTNPSKYPRPLLSSRSRLQKEENKKDVDDYVQVLTTVKRMYRFSRRRRANGMAVSASKAMMKANQMTYSDAEGISTNRLWVGAHHTKSIVSAQWWDTKRGGGGKTPLHIFVAAAKTEK